MMSRSTFLKLGLAGLLYPTAAACSPAPMQVAQSSTDPSSPSAPDGVDPMPRASVASPSTGAVVYVCPMHPEVTSTTPGSLCPKCNMKLVPKN